MATITGLTAERMLEIEAQTVVAGKIENGHLILIKFDGTEVDAGPIPPGPPGPTGPAGGFIPGEVRLWPGSVLPDLASWGKWVWADGEIYVVATYPDAAANIASAWRTFDGASDPGAANFRVPDLRGVTPAGMDAMPGGTRANRLTRAAAATLAAKIGKETHGLSVTEMARHGHGGSITVPFNVHVNVPVSVSGSINGQTDEQGSHDHRVDGPYRTKNQVGGGHADGAYFKGQIIVSNPANADPYTFHADWAGMHQHSVSGSFSGSGSGSAQVSGSGTGTIPEEGDGAVHENVQPTVMVPYIVFLGA